MSILFIKFMFNKQQIKTELIQQYGATSVSIRNRGGKIYVKCVGVDHPTVRAYLKKFAVKEVSESNPTVWITSGGYLNKDFTFRVLV